LLKLDGLRATGAPEYDGTFPQKLTVAAGSWRASSTGVSSS